MAVVTGQNLCASLSINISVQVSKKHHRLLLLLLLLILREYQGRKNTLVAPNVKKPRNTAPVTKSLAHYPYDVLPAEEK
jgi:hypothetical protein